MSSTGEHAGGGKSPPFIYVSRAERKGIAVPLWELRWRGLWCQTSLLHLTAPVLKAEVALGDKGALNFPRERGSSGNQALVQYPHTGGQKKAAALALPMRAHPPPHSPGSAEGLCVLLPKHSLSPGCSELLCNFTFFHLPSLHLPPLSFFFHLSPTFPPLYAPLALSSPTALPFISQSPEILSDV